MQELYRHGDVVDRRKTASKTFYTSKTVTVNERKEVEINKAWAEQKELSVDLTGYDFDGTITSAKIGDTAFAAVRQNGKTFYFDKATIADMYGEHEIVALAETEDGGRTVINIPVLLVTKYIDNNNFQYLANYLVDVEGGKSGYFVQIGDIDATDKIVFNTPLAASFYGVYDGRGHVISNINISGYEIGMFTKLQAGAVVKNITFMDAVMDGAGGIVSSECFGTVENIVVYGSFGKIYSADGAYYAPPSLLVSKVKPGGIIRNCLVVAKDHGFTSEGYAGMICGESQGGIIENCIAVNLKNGATKAEYAMPAIGSKENGRFAEDTDTETVHTSHGWDAYMEWANGKDLSSYNGSAWKFLDNKTPVTTAESVQTALAAVTAVDKNVTPGETFVLGGEGWYASYTIGKLPAGVTYNDGVFQVSETASGSFTVTVTSLLDETKSVTFQVNIAGA